MPSTYAHYRFGTEMHDQLPAGTQEIIDASPELFMIGLHGPDILFYYSPFTQNSVNQMGYDIHDQSGSTFFCHAREVIAAGGNPAASRAYTYGVLCHFALDVTCHGFVDQCVAEKKISHTEIESEFDRMLMLRNGIEPTGHIQTGHIHPSAENAGVIAPFYPGITPKQIRAALRSMILQNRLLLARTGAKRWLIYTFLRLAGQYDQLHGLVINPKGNPACDRITEELLRLYAQAKSRAAALIAAFDDCRKWRDEKLMLDYNFNGVLPESEDNP